MMRIFRGRMIYMKKIMSLLSMPSPCLRRSAIASLVLTAASATGYSADYRLTAADVTAITALARTLFEAGRDGQAERLRAAIPTREEYLATFAPTLSMLADRHQRIVESDVAGLRTTFAGGTFVSIDGTFTANRGIRMDRCGRVAVRTSQCINGPRIEYRVGDRRRYFRIDRLVRLPSGVWKIFDARM